MNWSIAGRFHRPGASAAVATVAVAVLAVAVLGTGVARAAGPTVTGTGSSFAALEIEQWKGDVSRDPYNITINYQAGGSTQGRLNFLNGTVDFGASDIEFQPDEQRLIDGSDRKNFVYVPVSSGPLALMFNLVGTDGRRISQLNMTRRDVCRIFTLPDMTWNDPGIAAANPGVPLPGNKIRPVVRNDGSGTSFVLSEFCMNVVPDVWDAFKGWVRDNAPDQNSQPLRDGLPVSTWPQGVGNATGATASNGVAQTVQSLADSITYVDAATTIVSQIDGGRAPVLSVENAVGVFVPPEPAAATIALAYATPRDNGTFQLRYDGADPGAYFPSTYSYIIAQTNGFDPAKGSVLGTFLNYAVTAGQRYVEDLEYSRLSVVLVNLALDKVQQIPGAPPRPTDLAGAPPPPDVAQGTGNGGAQAAGGAVGTQGGASAAAGGGAAVAATPEQQAAQAAALTVAAAQRAAAEEAALADQAAADEIAAGTSDPATRTVVSLLLIGALMVAAGSFISKGTRNSWQKK